MEQHKKTIADTLWDTRKALDAAMASERSAGETLGRAARAALDAAHDPDTELDRLVELDRLLTVAKSLKKIESNLVAAARVAEGRNAPGGA